MEHDQLTKIVDAWVTAYGAEERSATRKENQWAVDEVNGATPAFLWEFILATYKRTDLSDLAISVLAAGPVEELLSYAGAEYIDRIEILARQDPAFNNLLGGVWQLNTPDAIWKRVEKVRLKSW
jgi:hypothetical protein